MKYPTLSEILELKTIRANRIARAERITLRLNALTEMLHNTSDKKVIRKAEKEIAELRKELTEHESFCKKAQKTIADFYKPAYREAA